MTMFTRHNVASLKLVFFFSMLSTAVDVSHERQTAPCPNTCRCGSLKSLAKVVPSTPFSRIEAEVFTINCTARELKEVPTSGHVFEADALLLADNKISHLDFSFLKIFPSLKVLTVKKNGLKSLTKSDDDYQPFYSLLHLDLSENQLHVIHSYVFSGFPTLKTLNLSSNSLHTISSNAFNLPALETIDLSRNQLGMLQESFFDFSLKLTDIIMSYNGISRLNDGTFGLLRHLELLDLSHNSLMKLEDNVLVGMNISNLDLGFNSLRKVPTISLRKLTAAKTIVLDGNVFPTLDEGALARIPVEFLSISNCPHLVRVEKGAISSMGDLEALTMNNNKKLAYFHPDSVTDSPRLTALDLSGNSLFALERGLADNLPQMRALFLSRNSFHCHCNLKWMGSHRRDIIADLDDIKCNPDSHTDPISLNDIVDKFQEDCEPYILPLFDAIVDEMMGKNISLMCKALGSSDIEMAWRLPQNGQVVRHTECIDRACIESNNMFTIKYLHPTDAGRYMCMAKNKYGQDQIQTLLEVKSEHIQIFPISVASTFVTLSWNTSGALSTGRGYILRVRYAQQTPPRGKSDQLGSDKNSQTRHTSQHEVLKEYDDIDVGLKMNSYTVNGLTPGMTYLFELCLRKDIYVISISSATLTTKSSGFEVALGIKTDYVTLFAVSIILISIVITCFTISIVRWWRYRLHMLRMRTKDTEQNADDSSQREMILSPSDPSSVNCPNNYFDRVRPNPNPTYSSKVGSPTGNAGSTPDGHLLTGDKSRLMDHEVASPTEEMRETFA